MISKDFVTAGNAIFTIRMPDGFPNGHGHYTYKVTRKDADGDWPETYFIGLLTGPDNTSNYQYLGILDPHTFQIKLTRASKYRPDTFVVRLVRRTLARIWAGEGGVVEAAGFGVDHEGRCGACGRKLTTPESIDTGFGPECSKRLGVVWERKDMVTA